MGRKVIFEIATDNIAGKVNPQCELSILVGMGSLSYCITDAQQQLLLLRDYDTSDFKVLGEFFLQDEYFRQSYRAIRIAVAAPAFTFLPARLYNPAEKTTYLQHLTATDREMAFRNDDIKTLAATNVYALRRDTVETLQKHLPGARIFHIATAITAGLLAHEALAAHTTSLHIHIHEGKLFLLLLHKKELQFVNVFSYQSARDFLYYVMLVFDQFKLDPEETPAFIAGQLIKDSEIYPLLYRYIRQLQFLPMPAFIQNGDKLREPHLYFNLFGVTRCGKDVSY
ncbi:MAG TPA: DUF3822 family protein [Saprospiraceae bacterium]|nr:DUF3822 family protein [Saprospiraceae bacterium]HMP23960.1 DUF3822 family protein [Saprospiraceae bacterium]